MTTLDDLRDAVRAYLVTLPAEEINPTCAFLLGGGNKCPAEAARSINGGSTLVCAEHGRRYFTAAPLPERVRMLKALASMVAEAAPAKPCDCSECRGTHRVVGSMGHERACDYCACVVSP